MLGTYMENLYLSYNSHRCMVSGCLAQPGDNEANSILYSLTFSKQKVHILLLLQYNVY